MKRYINSIKNKITLLKSVAAMTFKEWTAFRSIVAVTIFVNPVAFLVQYFIWKAVYTDQSSLNGMTFGQMLVYYGVSTLLVSFVWDNVHNILGWQIQGGEFITFLLRPMSYLYYSISQKIGHRIFCIFIEIIPIYTIFRLFFHLNLAPVYPVWAIISILLSFFLFFYVNSCIGTLAFWTTKTDGLNRAVSVLKDLCAGAIIPLVFLPSAVQKVLFFLPFQFITYVPIRVFIGSYELAGITMSVPEIVGLQALALVAMHFLYKVLWHFGIKRFTGVGS